MAELVGPLAALGGSSPSEVRDGLVQLLTALKRAGKEDVLEASVSEHVAAAMESQLASPEVQRWAAAVFQELFQRFEQVGQKDLELLLRAAGVHAKEGVLSLLAAAFQDHQSPSLMERVASLLAALVLEGGDDAADEATRTGCLTAALATLKLTVGNTTDTLEETSALVADVPLQVACLRVLWAVCESNGELGATEIAAADGLDIIVSILQNGRASDVCKWGASVFQALFAHGGELVVEAAVQSEVAEALVMALAHSLNDLEIVERCAAALATMSGYSDEAGLAVVEAGGLGAVEEAVERHGHEGALFDWYLALRQSIESHAGAESPNGPNADSGPGSPAPEVEIEL